MSLNSYALLERNKLPASGEHVYVKPGRDYEEAEVLNRHRITRCLGLFFSIFLLILAIGYLISSLIAVFDKRGNEIYFDESPNVYDFENAKIAKLANPSWHMRTDDWGYIYRAYQSTDPYWSKYNVFLYIVVTAAVTTFMWVIATLVDIWKYTTLAWRLAVPTFVLNFFALLFNLAGSAYLFYRISMIEFVLTILFRSLQQPKLIFLGSMQL